MVDVDVVVQMVLPTLMVQPTLMVLPTLDKTVDAEHC
jgi:hypothetical protein